MMLVKPMIQGIYANEKSYGNHDDFKGAVLNNVDTKNGKAGKNQG